jgi:hypothetical protein
MLIVARALNAIAEKLIGKKIKGLVKTETGT